MSLTKSCVSCRKKHLKCDGNKPCDRCARNGYLCEFSISRRGGFRVPKSLRIISNAGDSKDALSPSGFDFIDGKKDIVTAYYNKFQQWYAIFPPKEHAREYFQHIDAGECTELFDMLDIVADTMTVKAGSNIRSKLLKTLAATKSSGIPNVNDLVKAQTLFLGTVLAHLYMIFDAAHDYRSECVNLFNSGDVNICASPRLANVDMDLKNDMASRVYHEFLAFEVMTCIASKRVPSLLIRPTIFPSHATRMRFECVMTVRRVAEVLYGTEEGVADTDRNDTGMVASLKAAIATWQGRFAKDSSLLMSPAGVVDESVLFSIMTINYASILINMRDSKLLSFGPGSLDCANGDTSDEPCVPKRLQARQRDQTTTATWACIRAADNIAKIAIETGVERLSHRIPSYTCAVGMAMLVHIKAYTWLFKEQEMSPLEHMTSFINLEDHVMDVLGHNWPIAASLRTKLRGLVPSIPVLSISTASPSSSVPQASWIPPVRPIAPSFAVKRMGTVQGVFHSTCANRQSVTQVSESSITLPHCHGECDYEPPDATSVLEMQTLEDILSMPIDAFVNIEGKTFP